MIDRKGHRYEKEIILLCVRWYLAYSLSYRNLEEMIVIFLSTGQNTSSPEEPVELVCGVKDEVTEEIEAMSEESFKGAV